MPPSPTPTPTPSPTPTPAPTNSASTLVTSQKIPFLYGTPPFPDGPNYNVDPAAFFVERGHYSIPTASQPFFMDNLSAGLHLQNYHTLWFDQGIFPGQGPHIGGSPSDGIYMVQLHGRMEQIFFGPSDIFSQDDNGTRYAFSNLQNGELVQNVLSIDSVGPGTSLPAHRYATIGYFGQDKGIVGRETAEGFRHRFVGGSITGVEELPTGIRQYQVTAIQYDAYGLRSDPVTGLDFVTYNPDIPIAATVSITLDVNFTTREVNVRLRRSVPNGNFVNSSADYNVVARLHLTSPLYFIGDVIDAQGDSATVNVQFYGPNAEEVGVAFSFGHSRIVTANEVSTVGGIALGVAK